MCKSIISHWQPCLHMRATAVLLCDLCGLGGLRTPAYACGRRGLVFEEVEREGVCPVCSVREGMRAVEGGKRKRTWEEKGR